MQDFSYIDIVENGIKILLHISANYSDFIIKAGALKIMMSMIDFFFETTQKNILKIIKNSMNFFS